MPATPDHKVEMHMLARERIAAGKPVWDRTIRLGDVFHNEAMTFEQRRDAVVARLRASAWLKGCDENDALVQFVDELADAQDAEEFDSPWGAIYDEADAARVWIETH